MEFLYLKLEKIYYFTVVDSLQKIDQVCTRETNVINLKENRWQKC